jgi:cytochrome P450
VLIDLTDHTQFGDDSFWSVLAWLREHDPVHWHDKDGFWAVTRYDDAVEVYRDSDAFSSRYGMQLGTNPEAVAAVSQRMLIVSDPPDHTQLKRVMNRAMSPDDFDGMIREVVRELLANALEAGELDLVEVVEQLPTRVVCALLGVEREDWDWLGRTMTDAFEDPDEVVRAVNHAEVFQYFADRLKQLRQNPGADFVSRIAMDRRETSDGPRELTDEEIIVNCLGVMAGGNETTRYSTVGGVLAFAREPEQWTMLRERGADVVPTAIEEIMRWTTPGVHAMRTAMRPARIGDRDIAVGDRVTVWNISANRDERAFPDADRFRIDRTPNRHLALGGGRHLCIGAKLARLQLAIFLEELIRHVSKIEVTGEPKFTASNFTRGCRSLPVRLTAA